MNVAIIIPTLKIGGGQKIAIDIADKSSEVFFIVIGERVDNHYTHYVEKYHKVYYINKKIGFNPLVFLKIAKILNRENPNIVHFHLGVSLYGLVPSFFCFDRKLIYTFHTIADNDSKGLIRMLCYIGIKTGRLHPVAITETVQESIKKMYGIDRVELIHNGIDLSNMIKDSRGISRNQESSVIRLIAVGQLWKAKNYGFLLDVIANVIKQDKQNNYKLIILGDGPQRTDLERKAVTLGLENIVSFYGNVDDVSKYLVRSDIFLLTSLYEGLSLATLEAMASGLPVIATDVGGMKDIVKGNGYLLPLGDIQGFSDKIVYLANNREERVQMSDISLAIVKNFDKHIMRKKYWELYKYLKV